MSMALELIPLFECDIPVGAQFEIATGSASRGILKATRIDAIDGRRVISLEPGSETRAINEILGGSIRQKTTLKSIGAIEINLDRPIDGIVRDAITGRSIIVRIITGAIDGGFIGERTIGDAPQPAGQQIDSANAA